MKAWSANAFPIPVVAAGPGSQPEEDEALDYLPLPSGMDTFAPPRLPDHIDPASRATAVATLQGLLAAMRAWTFGTPGHPVVDLAPLDGASLALINDALGQGEVSARVLGETELRIQETVFAGIWRVVETDRGGRRLSDRIEACAMPAEVITRSLEAAQAAIAAPTPPQGVMNAPAVLNELLHAVATRRPGAAAHIVNLTLLPMNPADLAWLVEVLGVGPTVILSRGYGNCRITATALARTWWVQYFNSADTLILNTLEVTELPDVAPAAADDFGDSIARLEEWIATLCDA
ncbi:hydrogenase expression/formation protein [Azoarcus olearius]|uniref:Hydrogenase-1 operon protein hupH n=1 Tax=Azoarcus sp. (strain BH72) TaxID=418699 RepID=A1KC55_AZOSB|nr:hydrogenase expression/formation protein [Azoarcus olearius]CAL96411.1 hydrogenase-1 operon protein hupH [Azoarcus olearius]